MADNQVPAAPARAGLYVDGFNVYHALERLNEPFLKWLNLWRVGELLCAPTGAQLVRAVFCTAVPTDNDGKRDRHNIYISALRAAGVETLKGHHVYDQDTGKRSEKQSDINVALSMVLDAEDDRIDVAYLLTADSDQAASAKIFKERHPQRRLVLVAPPTQEVPKKVIPYADKHFVMRKEIVEQAVFPAMVPGLKYPIVRPQAYDPPTWWMHPDDRPQKA